MLDKIINNIRLLTISQNKKIKTNENKKLESEKKPDAYKNINTSSIR